MDTEFDTNWKCWMRCRNITSGWIVTKERHKGTNYNLYSTYTFTYIYFFNV